MGVFVDVIDWVFFNVCFVFDVDIGFGDCVCYGCFFNMFFRYCYVWVVVYFVKVFFGFC